MYYPTLEEVKRRQGEGTLIPVYREIVADLENSDIIKAPHLAEAIQYRPRSQV